MTICRTILFTVLLPGVLTAAQKAAQPPATAPVSDTLLDSIRTAPDPSSTIEAYVRGVADGRGNGLQLRQTYVRHMAELGAPELVDAQAHDLINRGAGDAFIAGIAAYTDAVRGNAHEAIKNLKLALTYSPRDSFLLRTAGQAVAWYDSQAGQANLPAEDAAGIEWLRSTGKGSREFTETYQLAMQARQAEQTPADQSNPDRTAGVESAVAPTSRTQAISGEGSATEQHSSNGASSYSQGGGGTSATYSYYYYPYSSGYSSSGYYNPYSAYGYYASAASLIAVRDGIYNRDVTALQRASAAGIFRGAGTNVRNVGGLPGNLNNLPRGFPGNAARPFSAPGRPGAQGAGLPPRLQAPPSAPPRPPMPPGPPHP